MILERFIQVHLLDHNHELVLITKFSISDIEKIKQYKRNWLDKDRRRVCLIYQITKEEMIL
jgi:hypothetical protein